MKALILAAGLGSRLSDLTRESPKALVFVNGRPILSYTLEALKAASVGPIGIVVGHAGQKIIDYVERYFPELESCFFWNRDYDKTNSSYSFWMAKEWVERETYIHLNCDIIFSSSLLRRLVTSAAKNVIAIRRDVPLGDQMENVVVDGDRILQMSLTNTPEANGKAFGLAKLSPQSTQTIVQKLSLYLKEGDRNQNYFGMIRQAVHHLDYRALDAADDLLLEVNTPHDLQSAEHILKSHDRYRASS